MPSTPWNLLLLPALLGAAPAPERVVLAMGTRLELRIADPAAQERALAAVARVEAWGSTWQPGTAFDRLNRAQGAWVALPFEALEALQRACRLGEATEGAFDPLLGPLVAAWGLRSGGGSPSPEALEVARAASGRPHLDLDGPGGRARLRHPGAAVEEGGFLKGLALDEARAAAGTPAGLLDFGGQVLAWGPVQTVAVAHPGRRDRALFHVTLANASLAVSGCSERGAHLLDPRTGRPAADWGAAAVVHPSAFEADALSTALFVMGPEAGFRWASARNLAAAFLFPDGTRRCTPAFARLEAAPYLESR